MKTQVESVNCGNCGAPLRIPETAQFVTCNHCQTSLAVKRMDSITLTEKMEQTHERLAETERRLAELVHKNELAEEHRRWEREERGLMTTDKHGNHHKPSVIVGVFGLFVTIIMAVIASNVIGGFAILIPLFGIFVFVMTLNKVNAYSTAHRRHKQRLRDISQRYYQSRDSGTHSEYLKQLESAPTPEGYLRELSRFS